MRPRTNYEMTQADLDAILDACKPIPMIMLHIGGFEISQQERANDAWAALGKKMGFDYMTVQPGSGDRFFTAIPAGGTGSESRACSGSTGDIVGKPGQPTDRGADIELC